MDVGNTNHWQKEQVVPSAEWVKKINQRWPLEAVGAQRASETARRYRYLDGAGEVGFISSISEPFCGGCTRARLTADGMFYTCLFGTKGKNMMPLVRQSQSAEELTQLIGDAWLKRNDRYSEERSGLASPRDKVEMYRIGG
jgi:cyclic pyranopterin phosphate synthase